MGLDINAARFLLGEKDRGVPFGHTLTLGRQGVYMRAEDYSGFLAKLGTTLKTQGHADDFFKALGAEPFMAMDASSYEGADLIHDSNEPIGAEHFSSVDTLIDGGTLEHIFNFPVSISNCMRMVRPGGRLIMMTPWHNYSGHGFYQFSPELLHGVLCLENGYEMERMLIVAEGDWYSVRKPGELKRRIEIVTDDPILLYITARRIDERPVFTKWPQQSDYSAAWQRGSYSESGTAARLTTAQRLSAVFPPLESIRSVLRDRRSKLAQSPARNPGLIRICPSSEVPGTL